MQNANLKFLPEPKILPKLKIFAQTYSAFRDQKTILGALTRILFTPANIFVVPSLGGVQIYWFNAEMPIEEVPMLSLGDKNRPIHWKKTAPSCYVI